MAPVYLRKRVRKPACCMDARGAVGDEPMVVIKVTAVPHKVNAEKRRAAPRAKRRVTNCLLVDSTGLKLCGPGEWLIEKHGTRKRRSWRKLHISMDAVTGQIVAALLTDLEIDDGS